MLQTIKDAISRKREDGEKGFSLIELIVVVAILGILVAIAIPVYGNIQATARHNTLETAAANAATSISSAIAADATGFSSDSTGITATEDGSTVTVVKNTDEFTYALTATGAEVPSTVNASTDDVFVAVTNTNGETAWAGSAIGAGHSAW